jgi:SAM-dependent methyltransferase
VASELSGAQLRRLWKELGREFSPEAYGRISEQYIVLLRRCDACGFKFFERGLAGNEKFYREIEQRGYYAPDRPEFARTLRFARRHTLRNVLDVGCGSGAFLDLARQGGLDTYGLELNTAAGEKARAKGHKVYDKLLHELPSCPLPDGFDLITLFQVLEHVEGPVEVLKQAARLLRQGGFIAVAVPSEQGSPRLNPYDPAQWPPHHVSRWRLADFEQLGRAANLRVVKKGGDLLLGSGLPQLWEMHNRLAPILGQPERRGTLGLIKFASQLYRKMAMKWLFPRWGPSIYAYFQAP